MTMTSDNTLWLVVGLAVIALGVFLAATVASRRSRKHREELRARFGPEYSRAVQQYGARRAERILDSRLQRVAKIDIRELSDVDRERFSSHWAAIQAQFVDDPRAAVGRANDLIKEVMRARGYASADDAFDQRAADLSVDHPEVVEHYRVARRLALTPTDESMSTEQLRQAVVHYRVLFADLLQPPRPLIPGTFSPAHA